MPPTETPSARRHALAFNAVGAALRPYGEYLRLSIREDIARSVVAALDDHAQAEAQRRGAEPARVVLRIDGVAAGQLPHKHIRDIVRVDNQPSADQPTTTAVCRCTCPGCLEGCCENDTPAPAPKPPKQDSTGWAWLCHLCPLGGDGHWSRRGANRARDRHLDTHGADHA